MAGFCLTPSDLYVRASETKDRHLATPDADRGDLSVGYSKDGPKRKCGEQDDFHWLADSGVTERSPARDDAGCSGGR